MSFLAYYFILYLFVSMHECTSRHLGMIDKEAENHLTSKNTTEIMAEHQGRNFIKNHTEQKEIKLEYLLIGKKMGRVTGRDGVQVTQRETKLEGWKNHGRSAMESKHEEPAINNAKDDRVSEVVVMDYALPHRKPPIHNIEP
ncbi:uncharacterized protein LOC118485480 [Helianthus annuus]|uniref:uncharacterized protein LOC118485480 n=1 Tax=Helianthus annuus TaxID=4232 RepID=UPI001652F2BD|nr:uncharacterized protein LOC118485480 [Helianthus annuus]